ncbi:hypothetical protein EVAR_42547_1 [Eumeta japonica]|uniref:Uncharacterized protein n=1 Tax=Eumeta variegata TaxID=151549 RepID=A0A4C1WUD9_EUMVA|nr:hypothetical protein EVAR_42547_1 [Eumeta japonica]
MANLNGRKISTAARRRVVARGTYSPRAGSALAHVRQAACPEERRNTLRAVRDLIVSIELLKALQTTSNGPNFVLKLAQTYKSSIKIRPLAIKKRFHYNSM